MPLPGGGRCRVPPEAAPGESGMTRSGVMHQENDQVRSLRSGLAAWPTGSPPPGQVPPAAERSIWPPSPTPADDLTGRVALVRGASSGARNPLRRGARGGRRRPRPRRPSPRPPGAGGRRTAERAGPSSRCCDVTDPEQVEAAVARLEVHGRLDVAVANAGSVPGACPLRAPAASPLRAIAARQPDGDGGSPASRPAAPCSPPGAARSSSSPPCWGWRLAKLAAGLPGQQGRGDRRPGPAAGGRLGRPWGPGERPWRPDSSRRGVRPGARLAVPAAHRGHRRARPHRRAEELVGPLLLLASDVEP